MRFDINELVGYDRDRGFISWGVIRKVPFSRSIEVVLRT